MTAPSDSLSQLPCTPGTYCMAVSTLAEPGSALISAVVSTVCWRLLTTSTSGATPVTITVSSSPPTSSRASTGATKAPVSTTPSRTTRRNPGSVKVTE